MATVLVDIVDGPIDVESLRHRIDDPDVGAHGWFLGVTRRTTRTESGRQVTQTLSYEAHRPMAIAELQSLANKAGQQFDLAHVVIVHRLGEVPVGQASVVVGCSSAHRNATFQAMTWIMETLKKDVPIWKQETYADGTNEWVHPTPQTDSD